MSNGLGLGNNLWYQTKRAETTADTASHLLLEDGSKVLLEDGSHLILE